MIFSLQSPIIPLLLAAGSIATATAGQDASLDEWHTSVNRTQTVQTCPLSCPDAGADPASSDDLSSWFLFLDAASFAACNETMLLSFNVQNDVNPDEQVTTIRGCKAEYSLVQKAMEGSKDDVAAVCSTPNHDIIQASVTISGNHTSDKKKPNCAQNVLTSGHSRSSVIGLFAGAEVHQHGLNAQIFSRFLEDATKHEAFLGQGLPSSEVVRIWADGRCVSGDQEDWMIVSLRVPGQVQGSNNATSSSSSSSNAAHAWGNSRLATRTTCKTTEVKASDGCEAVAKRCGIKLAALKKFNSAKTFCNTLFCGSLIVGQPVCCTRGKLPNIAPKPSKDGSCATYPIKQDDNCATIAISHGITVEKIETFKKKTWGWNGCKLLWRGTSICLSTGTPSFPSSISDAVCGPQVPSTKKPSSGTSDSWTKLNPCPLNVCCNVWGKCRTADDLCVIAKAATGAPGATAKGKNSCIASYGRDIINGSAPAKTMRYTHIHFAFANVTSSYTIEVSGAQHQFNLFKAMTGIKKIISFGGWDFSTKPGTFDILREAVKPANRAKFTSNIAAFVKKHNLDGVDIDWEYPGASDIPDIPSGDSNAGKDYYQTLSGLKTSLGSGKSVSFAALWDYNNKWTSPGCATGNCLRSHVNITETKDSLSMITKAGVPSNKIVVGISSYGRSFEMAQAGCTGPACKFTGSPRVSNAAKGRCTNTAGYISDAEIQDIIDYGKVTKQWTDAGSNILVYNNTEWVAYMDKGTKASRAKLYASYNFAGTSDWAVDLQEFVDGTGEDDGYDPNYVAKINNDYFVDCDSDYASLSQLKDRKSKIPSYCMDQYIVDVEIKIMDDALSKNNDLIDDGYDDRFKLYEQYTKEQVPSQINAFMGNGHAGDYFKCEETKLRTCCITCPTVYKDGSDGIDWYNKSIKECQKKQDVWFWNYPEASDDIEVFNPKDVIGKSYDKSKDLPARLKLLKTIGDLDSQLKWPDLVDAAVLFAPLCRWSRPLERRD
ncbi:glycoside hydrolase family 18 protein [Thelonectria olida]|uniref:chitinase n=1 Tax=Thelonectria olida TaxID=1576542 RepID=A0A9P8W997_9HYPO|nr:glycoside hydrolase family 18 protein [Thelonectria olida]